MLQLHNLWHSHKLSTAPSSHVKALRHQPGIHALDIEHSVAVLLQLDVLKTQFDEWVSADQLMNR